MGAILKSYENESIKNRTIDMYISNIWFKIHDDPKSKDI
jgi:hypothetical protein